jgi:hypothetical protein
MFIQPNNWKNRHWDWDGLLELDECRKEGGLHLVNFSDILRA